MENNTSKTNPDLKNVIEVWKKVIDVQQHFNDIAMRIRNYALTLFTAIIAGLGILEKEKIHVTLFGSSLPASFILSVIGLFIMFGFFYMDKYWYHRLLVGAVKQGLFLENKYSTEFPEFGLTNSIGNASPHSFMFGKKIHSKHKFGVFYFPIFFALIILSIGLFPFSKHKKDQSTGVIGPIQEQKITIRNVKDTIIGKRDTTITETRTYINEDLKSTIDSNVIKGN